MLVNERSFLERSVTNYPDFMRYALISNCQIIPFLNFKNKILKLFIGHKLNVLEGKFYFVI